MCIRTWYIFLATAFSLLLGLVQVGYGQRARMYADGYGTATSGILGSSSVSNPHRAVGANILDEPARLSASGLGGSAKLQLKFLRFEQNIPSGTIVRVKIGSTTSNFVTTFRRNATASTDVDGSNEASLTHSISGNIMTLIPNQVFNAVALNITTGTSNRDVYHAYIEPYTLPLSLKNTTFTSCGPIGITDILNYAVPDLLDYEIVNTATNLPISSGNHITTSGNYYIKMTDPSTSDPEKVSTTFNVTINPVPEITLSETYIRLPINTSQSFPTVNCVGCGAPEWKDAVGNVVTQIPSRTTPGIVVYTVTVNNTLCSAEKQIVVDIYDPTQNCSQKERKYASLGFGDYNLLTNPEGDYNVSNKALAHDENPRTKSLLTSVSVLGLGGARQTIRWNHTIPVGTTIYVKMGLSAGLLGLVSAVTVQPRLGNASAGTAKAVAGGVIQLLAGENDIIYSFVTTAPTDGISIAIGGILSLGETVNLYDAWYEEATSNCPVADVIDVLAGSAEILKGVINAASVTVNVQNPYHAIDNDENSAAVMNSGVGVLAYAKLDVIFSSVSQPGDSVFIKVQSGVETLHLLGGFIIQRYLGNTPVGPPLDFDGTVLSLLSGANGESIIFTVTTEPYDRISIRYGGTANVLGQLHIYDIKRKPYIYDFSEENKKVIVCEGEEVSIGLNHDCLSYEWYDGPNGGNLIHTSMYRPGESTTTPLIATGAGTATYYIQPKRNGCAFGPRMSFTLAITPLPGKPHLTINDIIN